MKQVSKDGKKVIITIIDRMSDQEPHTNFKLDVNGSDSGIMPLCVELMAERISFRDENRDCFIISLAHYYEQNGDLMADPLMEFLIKDLRHLAPEKPTTDDLLELVGVWPSYFKQDGIFARYDELLPVVDGKITKYLANRYHDAATFTTDWMKNVKWQQKINTSINPYVCRFSPEHKNKVA